MPLGIATTIADPWTRIACLQPWWSYYANRTREDGDGRPIALTLSNVTHGRISNFHVISPPFWCNAVANSEDVIYDGMNCNATNTDPAGAGRKWVFLLSSYLVV